GPRPKRGAGQKPSETAEHTTMTDSILLDKPEYTLQEIADATGVPKSRYSQLFRKADTLRRGRGATSHKVYLANGRLVAALAGYGVAARLPGAPAPVAAHGASGDLSGDGQASA